LIFRLSAGLNQEQGLEGHQEDLREHQAPQGFHGFHGFQNHQEDLRERQEVGLQALVLLGKEVVRRDGIAFQVGDQLFNHRLAFIKIYYN
jgi:hypothetical protein